MEKFDENATRSLRVNHKVNKTEELMKIENNLFTVMMMIKT